MDTIDLFRRGYRTIQLMDNNEMDELSHQENIKHQLNEPLTNHGNFEIKKLSSTCENDPPTSKKLKIDSTYSADQSIRMMENVDGSTILPGTSSEKEERTDDELQLEFDFKFDPTIEIVQINENVLWLRSPSANGPSQDELNFWMKIGPRKTIIDDEIKFCDPLILQRILKLKTMFDRIDRRDIVRSRSKCNPFEGVRCSIFGNRTAIKMANLDATLDFMFTNPRDENGESMVKDLLYFADLCSGPGGFWEYILWRKKWLAKGFGFTLQNDDDFNLKTFSSAYKETFETFYGVRGDANLLDPENIESLQKFVLNRTYGTGVHFVMADGGFAVGEKNIQEITLKQLYLCQCLTALSLVREGGSVVIKFFDLFTLFSAGLIYLMYKCFKQILIIKPNSSRPGNSERYLIGRFMKDNTDSIRSHLTNVNKRMWDNRNSNVDVLELVPYEIIKDDQHFYNYLYESNNTHGRYQVTNLLKIIAFCNDETLIDPKQEDIRSVCLNAWKLPINSWKCKQLSIPDTFKQLMGTWIHEKDFMLTGDQLLTTELDLHRVFRDPSDWYFVPVEVVQRNEINIRTFFMSRGGHNVFFYSENAKWESLENVALEISKDTLIYGEIVTEFDNKGDTQTPIYSLHIIDGMILGGTSIRQLPLKKRSQMCEKFANSLNKEIKLILNCYKRIPTCPISCKKLYPLKSFRQFFNELNHYNQRDGRTSLGLKIRDCINPDRWYAPRGLLFFNDMKPNIEKAFSKTYQKRYFVDLITGKTFFLDQIQNPQSIYSSFKTTFVNRRLWEWKIESQVCETLNGEDKADGILYRGDLDRYIYE